MDAGQVLKPDMQDEDGATLQDILSNFHGLTLDRAKVLGRQWRDGSQQQMTNTPVSLSETT